MKIWDRFWNKVEIGDCWQWLAATNSRGYGHFWDGTRLQYAHRFIWQELVGPIPEGLTIDHLCRNKRCVNPDHLEVVEPTVNWRRAPHANTRKQVCSRGHAFDEANTEIYRGKRKCLACVPINNRSRS